MFKLFYFIQISVVAVSVVVVSVVAVVVVDCCFCCVLHLHVAFAKAALLNMQRGTCVLLMLLLCCF